MVPHPVLMIKRARFQLPDGTVLEQETVICRPPTVAATPDARDPDGDMKRDPVVVVD